ncbi:MAG: 4Fe-4S binding protein [Candidatus Diapherotrites archaeon]|uniref:4Fe-4S binding protein n=1 Tax=Candidatus Iainarchaeum sp. TaxID=3101447 RepID=A0A7J4KZC1_9ARCH|nr:4Fe-4S binding protein [Candidatus Diapherotrites archaeon]HIH21375.1 4Fe-4S binding protein [Candidatus Diapherotrites archaeon]HIH32696.1 4Fe-4S binding protein [Candidatus Diapherotrites archaeon]
MPDTGSWKTFRPVIDYGKCIKCMLCWVHCPDTAIKQRQDGFPYSKYIECKGCGACAEVCPVKCIEMQRNRNDGIERSDLLQFRKEA